MIQSSIWDKRRYWACYWYQWTISMVRTWDEWFGLHSCSLWQNLWCLSLTRQNRILSCMWLHLGFQLYIDNKKHKISNSFGSLARGKTQPLANCSFWLASFTKYFIPLKIKGGLDTPITARLNVLQEIFTGIDRYSLATTDQDIISE